jgi:hypothetical protein
LRHRRTPAKRRTKLCFLRSPTAPGKTNERIDSDEMYGGGTIDSTVIRD